MNFFLKNIYIAFLTFFFFSCISNSAKKADNFSELSSDILGSYRGIQPSYYLKNVNGEDAVVNGEKILFPSTGFQFFIKADGKVSFQQTNLQDNTKYYYNGTYKMVSNTNDSIELECSLIYEKKLDSTDHNSYYILVLAINKSNKNAKYSKENEPQFILEKISNSTTEIILNNSESKSNLEQIKMGTQIWAKKNSDISTFKNGDYIPEIKTPEEWEKAGEDGKPGWCYYNNDTIKGKKYGKLYNWYAVRDSRGLGPNGWHIPSNGEWAILISYLGGEENPSVGWKMKSLFGWNSYKSVSDGSMLSGNGTNESGFDGLPGGYRYLNGSFKDMGTGALWWSSTGENYIYAWYYDLDNTNGYINKDTRIGSFGLSLRYIKD